MAVCLNCQWSVAPGEDICENCGAVIATLVAHQTATIVVQTPVPAILSSDTPASEECPRCHRRRKAGAKFCNGCGLRYNEQVSSEVSQEQPPVSEQVMLKIGDLLNDKYKIVQTIGEGGMGAVFLAEDQLLKRKVVIKTLLSTHDRDLIAQSIKEREFLAALKHTNIVAIYDFVSVGAQGYIVMEYVEGKTLEQMLSERGRPFEVAQATRYILAILPAFIYLGKLGLVYCDFKPQNVMLEILKDGTEIAKLIDLGTVIKHEPNPLEVYGTNGYYAPEAVKTPSPETDLYSICRTLAFLITEMDLASPFFGMPASSAYKPFQNYPALYRLLVKGTHTDPAQRFQTAEQLRDQLSGVLRQIEGGQIEHLGSSRLFLPQQFTSVGKLGRRGVTALDENDPAIDLLRSGDRALHQGDYATASDFYTRANRNNPKSIDAHLRLAEVALEQGQLDNARLAIDVAQNVEAGHWKITWMLARLVEARLRPNDAIVLYTQLCNELPGELLPQQALARLYNRSGNKSQAATLYLNILKADPLNSEALLDGAQVLVGQNRWQEAAEVLQKVPDDSRLYVEARLFLYSIAIDHSWSAGQKELELAFLVLQSLEGKTNDPRYYLAAGDFYRLLWKQALARNLPAGIVLPGIKKIKARHLRTLAEKHYIRYLQLEPHAEAKLKPHLVEREDVLRKKLEVAPWRLF